MKKQNLEQVWLDKCYEMGTEDAKKFALTLGFELVLDYESLRSFEGFYPIKGCVELCSARAR